MTTAPRLRALLPDEAVQRESSSASARSVMGSPPWGRGRAAGHGTGSGRRGPSREVAFVPAAELRAGFPDGVLQRVGECRRRRGDDVRVAAHRGPGTRAVHRVDDHSRPSGGRRPAVEDADLVVDEMDLVEARGEGRQCLAQRRVECVDRAVAIGSGMQDLAFDLDLDGRLGQQLAPVTLLDEAGVVDDPERRDVVRTVPSDEQLEARLGTLEREAVRLELLDQVRQFTWVDDAVELETELPGTDRGVGTSAELGDDEATGVTDRSRVDVLVAPLDLRDGGAVDTALVREG